MNTTELKALADQCICHPASRGISEVEKAGEGLKELIAAHEDAQGEIRALRERVKALEEALKGIVALCDDPSGFMVDELNAAARALLEQKP